MSSWLVDSKLFRSLKRASLLATSTRCTELPFSGMCDWIEAVEVVKMVEMKDREVSVHIGRDDGARRRGRAQERGQS